MISPGPIIREYVKPTESLLSVCCGIGLELYYLDERTPITGVDVVHNYLREFKVRLPWAKTVKADALSYLKTLPDKSFDVVSCIDGVEHLTKKRGIQLLKEIKRVARKKALIFTPQGYTENHPENTWGISGGDKHQEHLSGWEPQELRDLGYELLEESDSMTAHGVAFKEAFYVFHRNSS